MRKLWMMALLGASFLWPVFSFKEPEIMPLPAPEVIAAAYPKDYFQRPVNEEIKMTGTFGELRSDHFHSGLDIKSNTGRVGQPILAAAEGFVDRIQVQAGGYGNVLYLKHPNGYTTVYAHLDAFSADLQQYVREAQYKSQRFEVNLHPPDGLFKIKQGQQIGRMGNSGGSTGPHLHFEIRHSATQKVLNPLLFGIPVQDKVAPEIRDMKVYFLDEQRGVIGSKAFPINRQKDGTYGLEGDTVLLGGWRIGFGVKTYDGMSGFRNDNGVYAVSLYADDQLAYEWRMDELDFDESRYLNAHIDYSVFKRYGAWFHRCFVLPGDLLSNYAHTETLGSIPIYAEKPVKILLKVVDAGGNACTITFWAQRDTNLEVFPSAPFQFEMPYNVENRIDMEDFSMILPKGSLYETLEFQYSTTPDEEGDVFSPMHHLHNGRTPVHRYFTLKIRPHELPDNLRSKAIIAKCGEGKPDNCGVSWEGDFLMTKVREFGDYCVMVDTVPPKITPVVFATDMRKKGVISFRINDNFAITGLADRLYYRGTVDNKWILFEYDRKRARLTYTFDGQVIRGEHVLKLVVKDDRDNLAKFERKFVR